jgi:D-hydroxyproline dehydrogenase subunit beta
MSSHSGMAFSMTDSPKYDDAVIGAGIIGLAHAYHLARRGRRVVVFERGPKAAEASIRNFGMIWPIGQPAGPDRALAKRSAAVWLEVLAASGIWHEPCGSLHLAYHEDEAQVLREFCDQASQRGENMSLLGAREIAARSPDVVQSGLQLGLWSPYEVCVDPREAVAGIADWLAREHGVTFRFNSAVTAINLPEIVAGSTRWSASRAWCCSGADSHSLFGGELSETGLVRCKLQMMRTDPLENHHRIGPMLAAGLTLRHYTSFRDCPTLPVLKARVAAETPWFDRYGVHVLVSQNGRGELTLGDSHEYGDQIEPFDKAEIDDGILAYLETFFRVPSLRIASRWHGIYVKHPTKTHVLVHPSPNVTVMTGLGGAGMTLSFGLAEQIVARELGELSE